MTLHEAPNLFGANKEQNMFSYFDPDRENYIKVNKTPSAAYKLHYQLVFSVKYRKALLEDTNIAGDFTLFVRQVSEEKGYHIFGIEIRPEHVHIVAGLKPEHSISQLVKDIKGRTSRLLREKYPRLKDIDNLWTSGYSVDSLGEKNIAQIIAYLQRQDEHHG